MSLFVLLELHKWRGNGGLIYANLPSIIVTQPSIIGVFDTERKWRMLRVLISMSVLNSRLIQMRLMWLKCIQLMDQLEYSRIELKSLQLATKLLQNANMQNNTEPLVVV